MQDDPDVITGWNIQLYDIPYICKRLRRVLGEKLMKRMSPWGLCSEGEVHIMGRTHTTFDVGGVCQLDYLIFIRSLLIRHKSLTGWIILQR